MRTTPKMSLREKLEALAPKPYTKGKCVPWQGYCNNNGYGVVSHLGRRYLAHIVQAQLYGIHKYNNQVITRTCHLSHCVNPRHLTVSTLQEVMRDKVRREGRSRKTKTYPPKNLIIHRCAVCSKDLGRNHNRRKYCSDRCRQASKNHQPIKCKWCQKPRERPVNLKKASVYCSRECFKSYFRVHIEVYTRKKYSTVHFRQCVLCKANFFNCARRKDRKTCSKECLNQLTTIRNRERTLQRLKSARKPVCS